MNDFESTDLDQARQDLNSETRPESGTSQGAQTKLVFRSGPLRGKVLVLEKDTITIGRDTHNDIAINDHVISGFHSRITRDREGRFLLEDLDSKNGTYLRGKRLERKEQLRDGDLFCICKNGPEVQFTQGTPKVPSLLGCTTSTLARTGSIETALREIFPGRRRSGTPLLTQTGVRELLNSNVNAKRERRFLVTSLGIFLLISSAILGATLYLAVGRQHNPHEHAEVHDRHEDVHDVYHHESQHPTASHLGAATAIDHTVELTPALQSIYGSLYFTYRNKDSNIGSVKIANDGSEPLTGGHFRFRFDQPHTDFLSEPFRVPVPTVPPGTSHSIQISPKLADTVLSDSNREVTAITELERDGRIVASAERAVLVYKRDVFNWEDPRRVAIFVDPDDRAVSTFVRRAWPYRPASNRQEFPPPNVVGALTLLNSLTALNLSYVLDAQNPLAAAMDQKANDRINFPIDTVVSGRGDCDDLSVLCCSLLEAVHIRTAFAIGNGHVLFLFDSGVTTADLPDTPFDPKTVIEYDGRVWIPIEATDLSRAGANFASAWAASWRRRESILAGEMQIVEVKNAWKKYVPMNQVTTQEMQTELKVAYRRWRSNGLAEKIEADLKGLRTLFRENLATQINQIAQTETDYFGRLHATGLLYARSGLYDPAKATFAKALFQSDRIPAVPAAREQLAKQETPPDTIAILLTNLGICLALGANTNSELMAASAFTELALEHFPEEAKDERGELMLRLALTCRLRGDLSNEKQWQSRAYPSYLLSEYLPAWSGLASRVLRPWVLSRSP